MSLGRPAACQSRRRWRDQVRQRQHGRDPPPGPHDAAHEIFDPETNRRVLVDHAFIVAGGEITKQARNWLGNALDAAKRTPACAGSTRRARRPRRRPQTHPRLRGEHQRRTAGAILGADSPPLARGARRARFRGRPRGGLTPACAGSTQDGTLPTTRTWTHPRLRGEHPPMSLRPVEGWDSPPLARGARGRDSRGGLLCGLTPACAGSTSAGAVMPWPRGTHPRLRGEHICTRRGGCCRSDSPPLARGARVTRPGRFLVDGLTPACAGSTLFDLVR